MTEYEIELDRIRETYGDKMEVVPFAGKVPVNILLFRRHTHDFEKGWETEYLSELADTLKPGMCVYDIGAEQGEFTAMAAKIVGGENVHIFEPSPSYWPNIKRVWDANDLGEVGGVFNGYVSDSVLGDGFVDINKWPACSGGEIFYGTNQVEPKSTPRPTTTIDRYSEITGTMPNVVMMDIEGAELAAVRGAIKTIQSGSPIFFISIHDNDLINMRSGGSAADLFDIFSKNGYNSWLIKKDHEEHWKFWR